MSSPTRTGHAGVWDPAGDRMIVFGGSDSHGRDLADTWALSFGNPVSWTQLSAGAGPAPRSGHVAVLDAAGNRLVIYGGISGTTRFDDVWALALDSATWTQLTPTGTSPGGRYSMSAVFDPSRNRMIVFGGRGAALTNETWALDLDATPEWTLLATSGTPPVARDLHTAIYQSIADRMIVYGGSSGDPVTDALGDVWSLNFAGTPTWEELSPVGDLPQSRSGASAVYVPSLGGMYLFGGQNATGRLSDVQLLSLPPGMPEWMELSPLGPMRARHGQIAVLDPGRDRMLMMGGIHVRASSETWALETATATWIEIDAVGRPPAPRWGHTMIYDPPRDRLVVFGGTDTIDLFNDVWEFPLASNGPWKRVFGQGAPPPGRAFHSAIYDPVGDRMIIYGGFNGASPLGDVWSMAFGNFDTWTKLIPSGSAPVLRQWHSAVYNDRDHRMTIYGGYNGGAVLGDVRELDLATTAWTAPTTPPGTLPADRCCHQAVLLPVERKMLIMGGSTGVAELGDTWELPIVPPGSSWSQIFASGVIAPRTDHAAVLDWKRNRLVAFGGVTGSTRLNDVSALSFGAMPSWSAVVPAGTPPYARSDHPAVYDPIRDRMLVFGGYGGDIPSMYDDLWTLTWGEDTAIGLQCPTSLVFTPGDTVTLDAAIMNPFLLSIPYEYQVTSERAWPGVSTSAAIDATSPLQKLNYDILAPDSAAVGNNTISLRVWVRDAPRLTDSCTCLLKEISTPVLVSLVSAEASPGAVRLSWYSAGDGGGFVLSRSQDGDGWAEIARPATDGRGRIDYVDRDVVPGRRYGYRLARDGAVLAATEVWVDVPEVAEFGLHQIRYQGGAFRVDLSLTGSGPARLEILDAGGRRVAGLDLSTSEQTRRTLSLASDLPAGIYFARLLEGQRRSTARALVLR